MAAHADIEDESQTAKLVPEIDAKAFGKANDAQTIIAGDVEVVDIIFYASSPQAKPIPRREPPSINRPEKC